MHYVSVAKDFTRFPAGRYKKNGATSGEAFRERFLEVPLSKGEDVTVDFDGTVGYGSSFLEEAFGGAVRTLGIPAEVVLSRLTLRCSDESICDEVRDYVLDAGKKLNQ